MFKSVRIHGRSQLQVRWEIYNLFNHPQYLDVDRAARFDALGNQVNADEYRRRARQWQRDIDALNGMPAIEQPAANSEWPAHLPPLRRASDLPAHHITPSDHR